MNQTAVKYMRLAILYLSLGSYCYFIPLLLSLEDNLRKAC